MDLHLSFHWIVVYQPDRAVVRVSIAQHISNEQLASMTGSNHQHSSCIRAQHSKPFTEPSNHQSDTSEKESAQHAREDNDRAGIRHPPKETMHYTKEHDGADDGGPENTA